MIAALLWLAQAGHADIEVAPPVVPGLITVEALMRTPKTGPLERAELAVIADALLADTEEYGHRQLINLTVATGDTVRDDLYPDCLRVRFSVAEADAASVVPMLANIVHGSELQVDDVQASIDSLGQRRRNYWASALEPEVLNYSRAKLEDIQMLYKYLGRPENLVITFATTTSIASDLLTQWTAAASGWDSKPVRLYPPDSTPPKPIYHRRGKLTTVLLRGKAINPAAPDFATNLMAIFALGAGKESAVWKALREGLGWSYRQEAILRNSPDGLEPDVEVVTEHSGSDVERSQQVRPALLKIVTAWTEGDKNHAIAAAEALFDRGVGLDPLYFKSTEPATADALFMDTYWRFKTGEPWRPQILVDAMRNVDVQRMRDAATAMLNSAGVELIQGTEPP